MKTGKLTVLLVLVLSLLGCGKPVPAEKSAYVGAWQGNSMDLAITQDGSVRYKRINGSATTDRKSTRLNSSHSRASRMPSSA